MAFNDLFSACWVFKLIAAPCQPSELGKKQFLILAMLRQIFPKIGADLALLYKIGPTSAKIGQAFLRSGFIGTISFVFG